MALPNELNGHRDQRCQGLNLIRTEGKTLNGFDYSRGSACSAEDGAVLAAAIRLRTGGGSTARRAPFLCRFTTQVEVDAFGKCLMLSRFFELMRSHDVPASTREYLDLLRGLKAGVVFASIDDFYEFAKLTLVKNEAHFDRFDRAFAAFWDGVEVVMPEVGEAAIPHEWLQSWPKSI